MSNKFDRRELLKYMNTVAISSLMVRCKPNNQNSQTKDLVNSTGRTSTDEERVQEVVEKKKKKNWVQMSGNSFNITARELSVIPDEYLKFLQERSRQGFKIINNSNLGGAAGMCRFNQIGATLIELAPGQEAFATIHEVGHGVEFFTYRLLGINGGSSLAARTHSAVTTSGEARYIRSYAKSNRKELFADGFSSFYRSPSSRQAMNNMPLTKSWLQSVLLKPVNLSQGEGDSWGKSSQSNQSADSQSANQTAPSLESSPKSGEDATVPGSTGGGLISGGGLGDLSQCGKGNASLICQLLSVFAGQLSGGSLSLNSTGAEMVIPSKDNYLTPYDQSTLLIRADGFSEQEMKKAQVYIGNRLVATGLSKDRYVGVSGMFSVIFVIPEALAPVNGEVSQLLRVVISEKEILSNPIKLARHTICGNGSMSLGS